MDALGLAIPGLNTLDLGSLETKPQTGGQQTEPLVFSGVAEWQQRNVFKDGFRARGPGKGSWPLHGSGSTVCIYMYTYIYIYIRHLRY